MFRWFKREISYLFGGKRNSGVIGSIKLLVYLEMVEENGERIEVGFWKRFVGVWW